MRMVFALLAEAGIVAPGNRFSILNGDLNVITPGSFPAVLPVLSLVAKVEFEPSEVNRPFPIRIEVLGPDDSPIVPPATGVVSATSQPVPLRELLPSAGIVATFPGLTLSMAGKYTFRVVVNEEILGSTPLFVIEQSALGASPPAD